MANQSNLHIPALRAHAALSCALLIAVTSAKVCKLDGAADGKCPSDHSVFSLLQLSMEVPMRTNGSNAQFSHISFNSTVESATAQGNSQLVSRPFASNPLRSVRPPAFAGMKTQMLHMARSDSEFLGVSGTPFDCKYPLITDFRTAMLMMCLVMAAVSVAFVLLSRLVRSQLGDSALRSTASALPCAPRGPNLRTLDGLKVIMTTYIVLLHALPCPQSPLTWCSDFNGHALMQFFFVVSGFVCQASEQHQRNAFDWRSGIAFFLKRLVRLAPLYWVALLWLAALDAVRQPRERFAFDMWPVQASFAQTIYSPLYCTGSQWDTTGLVTMGNGAAWFVSDIVILSMFFPLLFNTCPGSPLTILLVLPAVITVRTLPTLQTFMAIGIERTAFFSPLLRMLEMYAGMLSAKLFACRLPAWVSSWRGWGVMFDFSLVLALAIFIYCTRDRQADTNGEYFLVGPFCLTCVSARCAAAVVSNRQPPEGTEHEFAAACGSSSSWFPLGVIGRLAASDYLQKLVNYSYAIYVLQYPVIWICHILPVPSLRESLAFFSFFALLATHVVGVVVTQGIQTPVQRYLDNYLRGPK